MKKLCVAVLAFACASAFAGELCGPGKTADYSVPPPVYNYDTCMANAQAFVTAAQMRDAGESPKSAFDAIERMFGNALDVKTVCHTTNHTLAKNLVNSTFFDSQFSGPNAYLIAAQLRNKCEGELLHKNNPAAFPEYQPLK